MMSGRRRESVSSSDRQIQGLLSASLSSRSENRSGSPGAVRFTKFTATKPTPKLSIRRAACHNRQRTSNYRWPLETALRDLGRDDLATEAVRRLRSSLGASATYRLFAPTYDAAMLLRETVARRPGP
jgi:hypothetical protein